MKRQRCGWALAVLLAAVPGCGKRTPDLGGLPALERLGAEINRDKAKPEEPVTAVDLHGTAVIDAELKNLQGLDELEELDLSDTAVTDAGLKELKGLKGLKTLLLANTKVTDAGMRELAEMKQLDYLYLEGTRVTEVGRAEIRKAFPDCDIQPDSPSGER